MTHSHPPPEETTSLVSGVAGFIGSHLAEELLRRGHRVVGIDDLSGGIRSNVPDGVEFHRCDIGDAASVRSIMDDCPPTYIFHLAAYAAEGLSHHIRMFNYSNNIVGSANLINEAIRSGSVRCFVFASSAAVYGRTPIPYLESSQPLPSDPYGIAKFAVELDLASARDYFGLNSVIFRMYNVFGERQNIGDSYRNVLGIFMNNILMNRPMPIFGDGLQTRSFTYVGNLVPALADAVEDRATYGEIYNLGSSRSVTVREAAKVVAGAFKVAPEIRFAGARNEIVDVMADSAKARERFGLALDEVSFEEGVARMAEWARESGFRPPTRFGGIELDHNLPKVWGSLR